MLACLYRQQRFPLASAAERRRADALPMAEALEVFWSTYAAVAASEGVGAEQLQRVGEDAVGYCMLEVCRTALGFAGARDPRHRLGEGTAALAEYQRHAVGLVRHCLTRRRPRNPGDGGGGMRVLLDRMKEIAEHGL